MYLCVLDFVFVLVKIFFYIFPLSLHWIYWTCIVCTEHFWLLHTMIITTFLLIIRNLPYFHSQLHSHQQPHHHPYHHLQDLQKVTAWKSKSTWVSDVNFSLNLLVITNNLIIDPINLSKVPIIQIPVMRNKKSISRKLKITFCNLSPLFCIISWLKVMQLL